MLRFFKLLPLLLLAALFSAFAIDNREIVALSLFPLPFTIELPAFLMAMLCFLLGVGIASLVATLTFYRRKIQFFAARRQIEALENEVAGLRAERSILPPIA